MNYTTAFAIIIAAFVAVHFLMSFGQTNDELRKKYNKRAAFGVVLAIIVLVLKLK